MFKEKSGKRIEKARIVEANGTEWEMDYGKNEGKQNTFKGVLNATLIDGS